MRPRFRLTPALLIIGASLLPIPAAQAQVPVASLVSQVNIPYTQFRLKNGCV